MSDVEIIGDEGEQCIKDDANALSLDYYFPSSIYTINKPEWLETVNGVGREYLNIAKKNKPKHNLLDKLYPVVMTESHQQDERIRDIVLYVAQTGWNILDSQGYAMQNFEVTVDDWWLQDHHMHSANEEHIHPFGAQLTGFYFLECPPDCSRVVIHDSRPAKRQINLPEKNMNDLTLASTSINFEPKPGMLMIAPAWLPHSFSRHGSKKPFRFIHFNLGIIPARIQPQEDAQSAEVI
jgi:uncharacterized protein (TIGR02466 family)